MNPEKTFDPDSVSAFVGLDAQGDAAVYFQILDDEGEHVRYLTMEELTQHCANLLG